jgi:hypothetical protein
VVDGPSTGFDQLFAQAGERPMFNFLRQRQCLLWVKSPRRTGPLTKSGPGGSPDDNCGIPDIGTLKSGIRGKVTVGQVWPGR